MAAINDPRTLLEPDDSIKHNFLYDKIAPILGGILGFGAAAFVNYIARKPVFSGIQTHAIFTVVGAGGFGYLDKRRQLYSDERDAVYRHYLSLHPDDFPTPERKQIKDLFKPWLPVR